MSNLERAAVEALITKDFDQFDFADKPMEKYCAYNRTKHIQMATQLVCNAFQHQSCVDSVEVEDFIHGLNHLFFNGVAAGQSFEWFKKEAE